MYENVVAAYLSRHLQAKSETCCRHAEDRFYKQFSDPLPRWITGAIRLIDDRKETKGVSRKAPEQKEALRWHRLRLPKA